MSRRVFWVLTGFCVGVMLLWGVLWMAQRAMATAVSLPRAYDPVLLTGADFPAFANVPLTELSLYVYQNQTWQPAPFQVDEVTITGTFVTSEDGVLDHNDQLVFMGEAVGEKVIESNWPMDDQARLNLRYLITVTDPLSQTTMGWVYLYRSATLADSQTVYVGWDEPAQTLTAVSYTLSFAPDQFAGLAALTLSGQPNDVLDRQKIRVAGVLGTPPFIFPFDLTEEDIAQQLGIPVTVTLPITGPVRAIGGAETQAVAFYGARADFIVSLPLTDTVISGLPAHFDEVRVSLDLNEPGSSGLAPVTYVNSNGETAVIDGTPDTVATTPVLTWQQVSGATGGWVAVQQIDPANGSMSNYYLDDGMIDPDDTGDGRSFGDAGFTITDPNGLVLLTQTLYLLPGGTGPVGSIYQARTDNPLTAETAEEQFTPIKINFWLYLPVIVNE